MVLGSALSGLPGGSAVKTIVSIIALTVFLGGMFKAFFYRTKYGYASVYKRNEKLVTRPDGTHKVKGPGWHCKLAIRDDVENVNTQVQPTDLETQTILQEQDGKKVKRIVRGSIEWQVPYDKGDHRDFPARAVRVTGSLTELVTNTVQDGVRSMLANGHFSGEPIDSDQALELVTALIGHKLRKYGVVLISIFFSDDAPSEANFLVDALSNTTANSVAHAGPHLIRDDMPA